MKKRSKLLKTKSKTRKIKRVIIDHHPENEINEAKRMIGYVFEKWRDSKYER